MKEPIESHGQWKNARGLNKPNRKLKLLLPHEAAQIETEMEIRWPMICLFVVFALLWFALADWMGWV